MIGPSAAEIPRESLIAFARDLVAIPTENPPGHAYDACVARIGAELDHLGLSWEAVQTGDSATPRTSILATAGEAQSFLYLHGHYDVVPAFAPDQFVPRVEGGRLVGRGAADMKGGLAAMGYGARAAAERGARVGLVIVPDEETGGRLGAERLAALGRLDPSARGAILGEPTWGTIWHAARGAFTLQVTVRGRPAHVGLHYEGINAFEAAIDVVAGLEPLRQALRARPIRLAFASTNPRARESIILVGGMASGGTNFNIVPGAFTFTIDRRPNPDEDYDAAKRELLDALEGQRRRGIDLAWEVLQDAPSSLTATDCPLPAALAAAVGRVTGDIPSFTCCPGVLETRVYQALGILAVAFGPGPIARMHAPDEDVPIANLIAAAAIYAETAVRLAAC